MEDTELYRGHTIERRLRDPALAETRRDAVSDAMASAELYIDGEPVFTRRDSAGRYLAANYAYVPEESLFNLAKRIIDYRERDEEGGHGRSEEPVDPDLT